MSTGRSDVGMTRDEWVQAALAARVEQGLPEHVDDATVLDFLADVLTRTSAVASTSDHRGDDVASGS